MPWFPSPVEIPTRVWARLPDRFRTPKMNDWTMANRGGLPTDSFLEGPAVDDEGRLYVVDIPMGRVFRIGKDGGDDWTLVAEYDGWPNGLKVRADGSLLLADYRKGIVGIDPKTGAVSTVIGSVRSEGFKGVNDLCFSPEGDLLFTDQGQTGLQDPTGRVYRKTKDGALHCVIDTCPSPNGLVLDRAGKVLFVAITRAAQVWRLPIGRDATVSKAMMFCQMPGGLLGPDGLTVDSEDGVLVCSPGHGAIWRLDRFGTPTHKIVSCAGRAITNVAFGGPGLGQVYMTDSDTGQILVADAPVPGHPVPKG